MTARPLKKGPLRRQRAVQFSPPTANDCTHVTTLSKQRPIPDASKSQQPRRCPQALKCYRKAVSIVGAALVSLLLLSIRRARRRRHACRRRSQPSTLRVVAHVLKQGHAPRAPMEPPAVSRTASEGMERLPGKSCATCCTIFSIFCILILVILIITDLPIVIFAPWADVVYTFFCRLHVVFC